MIEKLFSPFIGMFIYHPIRFIIMVCISVCICIICILITLKSERINNKYGIILSVFFAILIYYTILGRPDSHLYSYNLDVFWSVNSAIQNRDYYLFAELLANCLVFLILTFLIEKSIGKINLGILSFIIFLSVIIEISQLILRVGLFELDDIISNSIGACLAYIVISMRKKYLECYVDEV